MTVHSTLVSAPPNVMTVGPRRVIACLNSSEHSATVLSHAYVFSDMFSTPITLLRVLESAQVQMAKTDPIEWDLRCREARSCLHSLAETIKSKSKAVDVQLTEGQIADAIVRFARSNHDSLLVLGIDVEHGRDKQCIGGTVHDIVDRVTDSVLLVPIPLPIEAHGYKRIAVPLDGSCWAESVLPMAVHTALAQDAELILVHVVPTPELMAPRPLEHEDLELRRQVIERNERTARDYLKLLQRQLSAQGLRVRLILRHGDDVRTTLGHIVAAESIDLMIVSARGQGGTSSSDIRYGHVASYLMSHAKVPVLIAFAQSSIPSSPIIPSQDKQFSRLPMVGPV